MKNEATTPYLMAFIVGAHALHVFVPAAAGSVFATIAGLVYGILYLEGR